MPGIKITKKAKKGVFQCGNIDYISTGQNISVIIFKNTYYEIAIYKESVEKITRLTHLNEEKQFLQIIFLS